MVFEKIYNRVSAAFEMSENVRVNYGKTKNFLNKNVIYVSRISKHLYSMDAFEKIASLAVAILTGLVARGYSVPCLETFADHKKLLYATLFFSSVTHFVSDAKVVIPEMKRVLLGIGNFFDHCKFHEEFKLINFERINAFVKNIGSYEVFGKEIRNYPSATYPLVGSLLKTPKNVFVIGASSIELYLSRKKTGMEWLINFIANVGKITVIVWSCKHGAYKLSFFIMIDVASKAAALVEFLIKAIKAEEDRFEGKGAIPKAHS